MREDVCVNVETRKEILPNVSQILYQVETIMSSSSQPLDTATDLWWDESGVHLEESYGWDDSNLSDVFLFCGIGLTRHHFLLLYIYHDHLKYSQIPP